MDADTLTAMTDHTPSPSPTAPVPGSGRRPVARAATAGGVAAGTPVRVTVVLRRRAPLDPSTLTAPLTREELAERFGATPADVEAVRAWAAGAGLTVEAVDAGSRRVKLLGPVEAVAAAFGTDVQEAQVDGVTFRQRTGELSVPDGLGAAVTAVLGIDDRPQARSRAVVLLPRTAAAVSYTPVELARVYDMPESDGAGRRIAIVELGGGYTDAELDTYFAGLGVDRPTVTAVGVDGASNAPENDPNGADGEVLLDIEVAGGVAPGAAIDVWFAPNTDAGFLDAVSEATHAADTPTAISISWGQSEDAWTDQARTAMDEAFADAAALGVTVTCAAGDDGSTDRATDGRSHVDFPAASPHALACGGTRLTADPATGAVRSETVWGGVGGNGATGGGVSGAFARPSWQEGVAVPGQAETGRPGRGVPDVAAVADPQTGYAVLVDGTEATIGGTSAVAPLWAALICRLAAELGRPLGLAQPLLYRGAGADTVPPGFRDVTEGSNGAYDAGPGWDACTGLGVPSGEALLAALRG